MKAEFWMIRFGFLFPVLFLVQSEFVPIENLGVQHISSREDRVHASKTECEFRCQLSKSQDLDMCKYLSNNTLSTCRCESRYNWNELLDEPATLITRCNDVYRDVRGCDDMCQMYKKRSESTTSDVDSVFGRLEKWRYNCRYFFNETTVNICGCELTGPRGCVDFDYEAEYRKYLFELSTVFKSPFILTIGFILVAIFFYYFLAYRKSEGKMCAVI